MTHDRSTTVAFSQPTTAGVPTAVLVNALCRLLVAVVIVAIEVEEAAEV